ncbi:MAG: NAD-dependent epimerase/dehydratase family protein [Thermoleophilaceae bacterium]
MEAPRTAFVTGGSGFVGGALIRRLVRDGFRVRGLARSERSAEAVSRAGAEPVQGDVSNPDALRAGAAGCELAFHAAARLGEWGPWEEFEQINVQGTLNVLEACRAAGVRRMVHVGTEAAVVAGQPLVMVDETAPLRPDSKAPYCASKALAEQAVRDANGNGLETVVVRPRLVWGPGDTTVLPSIARAVEQGRFAWIGGGRHRTSTTYIDNAVEGLVLGAERGRPGEAYFVTDGEPVEFREFVTRQLAALGVEAPTRTLPLPAARAAAVGLEGAWTALRRKGQPPLTRTAVWLSAVEMTIRIDKARQELGYEPPVSIDDGLERLRAAA